MRQWIRSGGGALKHRERPRLSWNRANSSLVGGLGELKFSHIEVPISRVGYGMAWEGSPRDRSKELREVGD